MSATIYVLTVVYFAYVINTVLGEQIRVFIKQCKMG